MKKYLVISGLLIFSALSLNAQTEIKINPIALMFTGIGVGIEYGVNSDFGVDLSTLIVEGGGIVWVSGKYYLNPRAGLDRFYVGAFLGGGTDIGPGLGFLAGTKVVSRNNKLIFEIGLGVGRSFDGGVIPHGRLSLGYRISGNR